MSRRGPIEFRLQLSQDADELVRFWTEGHPASVIEYAVVLRHLAPNGRATSVRVFDNSHGRDEHHMHRCDRSGKRRQPPESFDAGSPLEALMQARRLVEDGYEEMISGWQR